MNLNTKIAFSTVIIAAITIASYLYYSNYVSGNSPNRTLIVFSAGSLTIPLNEASSKYGSIHDVNVRIEYSGSVEAIRKITDLKRTPDLIFVADYNLIPKYLIPNYTSWYIGFAANQMVLVYTDKSAHHNILEKDPGEWYRVLMMSDVKWGFSDPNKDPCGYRAVGVLGLASLYYNDTSIIRELLESGTNIRIETNGSGLTITVPVDLRVNSENLIVRSKSVDLISLVEAGLLDYAFEYKSVAVQHGLKYVELPAEIDLGHISRAEFYGKVTVRILAGSEKEASIRLQPIIYGVTIPAEAKHSSLAIDFLKYIIRGGGGRVFEENGMNLLSKPLIGGNIPSDIEKALEK